MTDQLNVLVTGGARPGQRLEQRLHRRDADPAPQVPQRPGRGLGRGSARPGPYAALRTRVGLECWVGGFFSRVPTERNGCSEAAQRK
jgi:hypothetical protein